MQQHTRKTVIAFLAATLLVGSAEAQVSTVAHSGDQNDGESSACNVSGAALAQCSFAGAPSSTGTLGASVWASATLGGPLRIQSSSNALNYLSPCLAFSCLSVGGQQLENFADAQFSDVLTITDAPLGSSLVFFAFLSGSASQSFGVGSFGTNHLTFQISYGGVPGCFYCNGPGGIDDPRFNTRSNNVNGVIANSYQLSFPEVNGATLITMDMLVAQELFARNTFAGTWDESVDFLDTALLTGLEVLDANGNDITRDVSISSAEGITYPLGAPEVVPEPSSLVLLTTGLLAMIVVSTRRGRSNRHLHLVNHHTRGYK